MQKPKLPPRVLFIDDDIYGSSIYVRALEAVGLRVHYVHDVDTALEWLGEHSYEAVIIDIMMPCGAFFDEIETAAGYKTGLLLGREIRDQLPGVPLLALTNSRDADVEAWYSLQQEFCYCYKGDCLPEEFAMVVKNKILGNPDLPRPFIVHGHDPALLMELKNYLQNTLGLPEPVVLAEQPSRGMTLIEKFEHYAADSDLVFALFTPDDFLDSGGNLARQNVIFEYGYFLGILGRRSGRVFLLYKSGTDIPSDLSGIVYVDVSMGIEAAGETIRRELAGILPGSKS